ncbi:MAG: glycosyltransferase family 2 protein [Verrucomicrobiota bacterium]
MKGPFVSVIIPTYNRADTVARTIQSVLDQTYQPMEVIVVDDGSTDQTLEVLEQFDSRIQVIRQPNGGPSAARNNGVAHSKGAIIAFLDSDDTWRKDKLEHQVRMMEAGGESVPCCICNAEIVFENSVESTSFKNAQVDCGLREGYWLNPSLLIATRFLLFNQVVAIRRAAFLAVGGFNEKMRLLEDHDLAFKLSLVGPWAFLSEPMVEKSNDSDGLGVRAMKEPLIHALAWERVLHSFLDAPQARDGELGAIVRRNLGNIAIELRGKRLMLKGGVASNTLGGLLLFYLRITGGIRRRLPSWPKVDAVACLSTT